MGGAFLGIAHGVSKHLRKGDRVSWNSSQGRIEGTVVKTLTSPTKIKGHQVEASKDNPEVLVRSEKTGAEAAHKPGSLEEASGSKG